MPAVMPSLPDVPKVLTRREQKYAQLAAEVECYTKHFRRGTTHDG